MINCFPQIYEDELLYSLIARYRRMCGISNRKAISMDFYNLEQGVISILFPLHLNQISNVIPASSKITGEQLLMKNTLYEFCTKFLSQKRSKDIKESMLNETNVNLLMKVGINSSGVKWNKYLRYCPICITEDLKVLGESYWRREHQYMGVLICEKHKVFLHNSNIMIIDSYPEYICADDITINDISLHNEVFAKFNLKYIDLVKELLSHGEKRLDLIDINYFYKYKLKQRGLVSINGKVYKKKLLAEFKEFYPKGYLNLIDSDFKINDSYNWLSRFFDNNNKLTFRHLLMFQFLDSSIDEMFKVAGTITIDTKSIIKKHKPNLKLLEKRKKEWLKIVNDNPNKSRSQLKEINKAVHCYVYRHDKEWYYAVTPKHVKKVRGSTIDWTKRDKQLLEKVKGAVDKILNRPGKPTRVSRLSIRKELQLTRGMNNSQLVRTTKYIKNVTESNEEYYKRKIKWGIEEMMKNEEKISIFNIQLKCGFGGHYRIEIKELIKEVLKNIEKDMIL